LSPDEVILELKQRANISITRRTLLRYEDAKLIPEAIRGGKGRGRGRVTDYPIETPRETFASYALIHGEPSYKPEFVAKMRKSVKESIEFPNKGKADASPGIISWLMFQLLYTTELYLSGKLWTNYDYVFRSFDEKFKDTLPDDVPESIDLDTIKQYITIVYPSEEYVAVKQWIYQEKKWTYHSIPRNNNQGIMIFR